MHTIEKIGYLNNSKHLVNNSRCYNLFLLFLPYLVDTMVSGSYRNSEKMVNNFDWIGSDIKMIGKLLY